MKVGETVLVTAAAGATGHFGVQLAKLAGCHVVATVGSKGKADVVRQLGADRIINYHEEVSTQPGPSGDTGQLGALLCAPASRGLCH